MVRVKVQSRGRKILNSIKSYLPHLGIKPNAYHVRIISITRSVMYESEKSRKVVLLTCQFVNSWRKRRRRRRRGRVNGAVN